MLEVAYTQNASTQLSGSTVVPQEPWETNVDKVAKKIMNEQSPRMLMEVRGNLYELLAACLPPDFIMKEFLRKIILGVRNDTLKHKSIAAAAHFESTLRSGSK